MWTAFLAFTAAFLLIATTGLDSFIAAASRMAFSTVVSQDQTAILPGMARSARRLPEIFLGIPFSA